MTLFQIADSLGASVLPADTGASVAQLIPDAPPTPLESVMLQQDKLYVVAAVLTLIWIGLAILLVANDRRLARLERALDARDRATADPDRTGSSSRL